MLLSNSQVLILQTLAKNRRGLTRKQLTTKAGVLVSVSNLGPVYRETVSQHPQSLYARKLVTATIDESNGKDIIVYSLTARGKKAATTFSARKQTKSLIVPPKVLDPIVKRIKLLRTYAFELFTDTDLSEIRKAIGTKYKEVSLEDLKQQIINRRKRRAYVDENACKLRSLRRIIKEFGNEGTVIRGLLTTEQKKAITKYTADLNLPS